MAISRHDPIIGRNYEIEDLLASVKHSRNLSEDFGARFHARFCIVDSTQPISHNHHEIFSFPLGKSTGLMIVHGAFGGDTIRIDSTMLAEPTPHANRGTRSR